jgi:hypothetical protein
MNLNGIMQSRLLNFGIDNNMHADPAEDSVDLAEQTAMLECMYIFDRERKALKDKMLRKHNKRNCI